MHFVQTIRQALLCSDGTILFKNANISISKGDMVSLIGDNGSGKSTLLRIIAGKQDPACGEIDISSSSYYVPQYLGQYDNLKGLSLQKFSPFSYSFSLGW